MSDCNNCIHTKVCSKGLKMTINNASRCPLFEKERPHGEWISCSDRLPEDTRPVIVTWKNTDPKSYYQYIVGKHFIGTAHYKSGKWYWYSSVTEDLLAEYGKCDAEEFDEAIEVIAWMPLPKPYKEEGEAKQANDRQVTGKLNSEIEYKAKVKELEDAIARCERAEKEFKSRTCKFRSPKNCDSCAFHSECDEHWKEGEAE